MSERHLQTARTGRYELLGEPGPQVREVWFALHGHGQLARYFARPLAPLAGPRRLLVVPEALNRFYTQETSWRAAGAARVGATWMTKEDRLAEIEDYVRWLDAVHDDVFALVPRERVRMLALGFSQGVSTLARWLCRGRARADTVVLWAGPFPPELDAAAAMPLRNARILRVVGDQDEFASPEVVAEEERRIRDAGLAFESRTFAGGHALDPALLAELSA